jgi:YD repeat-containing protein
MMKSGKGRVRGFESLSLRSDIGNGRKSLENSSTFRLKATKNSKTHLFTHRCSGEFFVECHGKIASIIKSNGNNIYYSYDASGNRISKTTNTGTTVYVRDASGNIMSVYEKPTSGALQQSEINLYGSSRLGVKSAQSFADTSLNLESGFDAAWKKIFTRGERSYELTNHLGNVLATISDKRLQNDSSGTTNYYTAVVLSATDYYPAI